MFATLTIVLGLIVFEIANSVDNAIVNAHVLRTMSPRARSWFLVWGVFSAVFLIRGLLPLLLVWIATPGLRFLDAFHATFGGNPQAQLAIEQSAPILLIGGGMFLLLLYLHWLFLEKKEPYFVPERLVKEKHGIWFFGLTAFLLVGILYLARTNPVAMLSAATGNAIFFILYGFRELAEREEGNLEKPGHSDLAKLFFLEMLDASFSIDGVFGAFAFTTNVLLILIGNGIGALIVRQLTIKGMNQVAKYRWLKNGAMTSIGVLGILMIVESFGFHLPEWVPTMTTLVIVGVTFFSSHRDLQRKITQELTKL